MAVPFVASAPDPEVPAKPERRKFSAEDKKRILEEVDRATGHGGIGAVLRREGIYASTLHGWRKERDAAVHQAFSPKRGPQTQRNPLVGENEKLRRQNQRLPAVLPSCASDNAQTANKQVARRSSSMPKEPVVRDLFDRWDELGMRANTT
jgi:transposase-like protein